MVALASHLDAARDPIHSYYQAQSPPSVAEKNYQDNSCLLITLSARGVWGFNSDVRCEK